MLWYRPLFLIKNLDYATATCLLAQRQLVESLSESEEQLPQSAAVLNLVHTVKCTDGMKL